MQYSSDKGKQIDCTRETIAWLHTVWEITERGDAVQPDPFYDRNEKLTPETVTRTLNAVEGIFEKEFKQYPGYHNTAQGIDINAGEVLVPPRFNKLPYQQQFAIVQGIDKIFLKYRDEESKASDSKDSSPETPA